MTAAVKVVVKVAVGSVVVGSVAAEVRVAGGPKALSAPDASPGTATTWCDGCGV